MCHDLLLGGILRSKPLHQDKRLVYKALGFVLRSLIVAIWRIFNFRPLCVIPIRDWTVGPHWFCQNPRWVSGDWHSFGTWSIPILVTLPHLYWRIWSPVELFAFSFHSCQFYHVTCSYLFKHPAKLWPLLVSSSVSILLSTVLEPDTVLLCVQTI